MFQRSSKRFSIRQLFCSLLALAAMAPAQNDRILPAVVPRDHGVEFPKPVPAYRRELPAAFTKDAPETIADLQEIQQQVESLIARVSPAVVSVEVGDGTGSGVVISSDGLVLTAGHVCERAGRKVKFIFPDGKTAVGKTLGVDHDSDTGLVKITDPGPWPRAAVGELEKTEIGDWVLALGHPGGFDPKRSLVVRLGRIIRLAPDALQSDCPIAPGDSGGPLFDMHGRVIGIHSAISASPAENFHVPITEFALTWSHLAGDGRPGTGNELSVAERFGATSIDHADGCRLESVQRNSPASRAGLKNGDLVLRVEDREIKAAASFRRWVEEAKPGETLDLEIRRGSQVLSARVKLGANKK